ncbi:WecB/TagA/CpsF family glycosyltransferase [Actinopolymorpha rutila]|uniref:N-acetylglucosaminyldiphosphoundecaprenol N-acetyl-beta-D-mannosaminyltransferase n=1 Tax=Actinopolymorpha rutila TaxID=446787 RepID=A0A852Z3K9_9ACTN|nr:N-acetylglucosaminyldiphosphoundecaprenol N-acetyl-beta-D-mannosaminyltransferase [Actinopolymorpha rutila]
MTTPRHVQARIAPAPVLPEADRSRRTHICGVPVDILTMEETLAAASELIESGRPHQHVAINAAKVVAARRDPRLRQIIESCALANADGQSIVWASRLLRPRLPERVAGIDFMLRMWEVAANRGYRVYLLGAKPSTVQKAADAARAQGVTVVGARSGYWTPAEEPAVVAEVAGSQPDLLFVGLPTPRKEEFLHRHLDGLRTPLAVGVGGSFDVVAGEVTRAPEWMQRTGLEWVHRMRQEPRRLVRRYAEGNLKFVAMVVRDAADRLRRGPCRADRQRNSTR